MPLNVLGVPDLSGLELPQVPYSDSSNAQAASFEAIFPLCCALYGSYGTEEIDDPKDIVLCEQLREFLTAWSRLLSRVAAALHSDLLVSETHPGYLSLQGKSVALFIPWHIVEDLPLRSVLNETCAIGMQIAESSASTVCVSGSVLYFGSLKCISDLDFCEYSSDMPGGSRLITAADPQSEANIYLVEMNRRGSSNRYVEYITDTQFAGAIEVTNKKVALNRAKYGHASAPESHTLQEAPLGYPPRDLTHPTAVGRYIWFLAKATLDLIKSEPERAAKRALPFARLTLNRVLANQIVDPFDAVDVRRALTVSRKLALKRKAQNLDEQARNHFFPLIERDIIAARQLSSSNTERLTDEENELLDDFEGKIRQILASVSDIFEYYRSFARE